MKVIIIQVNAGGVDTYIEVRGTESESTSRRIQRDVVLESRKAAYKAVCGSDPTPETLEAHTSVISIKRTIYLAPPPNRDGALVFEWVTRMDYGPFTNRVTVKGREVKVESGYDTDGSWGNAAVYECEADPIQYDFPHNTLDEGPDLSPPDVADMLEESLGVKVRLIGGDS